MSRRLTRRRFARLAVAGGVAISSIGAVTAPFATTIFARSTSSGLIGVTTGPVPSTGSDAPEVDHTEFESTSSTSSTSSVPLALLVLSFELATGNTRLVSSTRLLADGVTPVIATNERIGGCAVLSDGSVLVAISPVSGGKNDRQPSRLVRLGSRAEVVALNGLARNEQLSDVLATAQGSVFGLVSKRSGAAPAVLVEIDPQTGRTRAVERVSLAGYWRFATLAESTQGAVITCGVTPEGEAHLVQLGLGRSRPVVLSHLTVDGTVWNNGLQSLVYATGGDLLAAGGLRYAPTKSLYRVDPRSGVMTRLYDLDLAAVSFSGA